jgi:Ca2+-binding RTX toxin-like protein
MVKYIRSDLDFILEQIKIAEAHALYEQTGGAQGKPLFGPNGSVPAYNVSWGLRTVDGTYNNLLHPEWGAADNEFPEPLGTNFRTIMVDPDGDGPMGPIPVSYSPTADNDGPGPAAAGDVFDPTVRTISNLLVDQTLGNPSAILTGLQRAGIVAPEDQLAITAVISEAYEPLKPLFNAVASAERVYAAASAAASASPDNTALQDAAAAALAELDAARATLDAQDDALMLLLEESGIELSGANVVITNTAPDEGLSAPFNSWFTLFGQFFDHGLDLVAKGGNGTVFIPLMEDDPLFVPGGDTNFMVLTRATLQGPGADGVLGTGDDTDRPVNNTTSFVDQNQTYTSHPSHQVFLRQYVLTPGGPVATGMLIEGADGGMATWGDVKEQARTILGIDLTDYHVGNLPLLATDPYGNFIPDPLTGFPQVVMAGPPQSLASGTPGSPLNLINIGADGPDENTAPDVVHLAVRTGHAFLADIAHDAVPEGKIDDGDTEVGLANPGNGETEYDNELLDAHFIAGDGRANENIGLTAVHHVFHSEHNRLVQHTKDVVVADAAAMLAGGATQAQAVAFLNEWLAVDVATVPTGADINALIWDGERLFQAAKFGTEMQYQHLVFEEFARKIQPNINVFVVPDGFDVTIDPSIVAEFAHVVYRFGHSMLTETIDRFDPSFNENHIGLIEGFLNPLQFHTNGTGVAVDDDIAAGAIIRGMTRQQGNEIDEFVTSALRNNLLGLPLDLATINLARGRDTGVPSLNEARAQFYAATNQDVLLKPYESWVDFAGHLKHEASIINFIAAYGTHALITGQTTVEGKRDAAMTLIFNESYGGLEIQADSADFLNATGDYAGGSLGGLNTVDLWIGGLAEAIMPFGGMLGSTFNFVFETQMERLQNGDRFYYLQRLDGLHLFGEMENNSFASLIMRNTDATHLPSDVFSAPGLILEVDQTRQFNDLDGDGTLESTDPTGGGILTPLVVRNNPATPVVDTNYLKYTGGDHVILGGTDADNTLIAGIGDDTLFGDGGNDRLEGGFGNDIINGGSGDDIIVDSGGDDNIKAEDGNDVVHAGPGLDLVMGGAGQDFIFLGTDMGSEVFAGEGNDFIYGNKNAERILGNEGNDWIETGTFDGAPGDNFDELFARDDVEGHDVFLGDGGFDEFIGEGGDDIMVGSPGRGKMAGMSGWDWATYKDDVSAVDADLTRGIVFDENPTPPQNGTLDAYEGVEGLSGTRFNDILTGSDVLAEERVPFAPGGTGAEGYRGSQLTKESLALISGLQAVLGLTDAQVTAMAAKQVIYSEGEIILGGDGSDTITGRAGDDIIDGDKWLDVQIGVFAANDPNHLQAPIALHNSMTTLANSMFNGTINPAQLGIVRTIRTDTTAGDVDVAKYQADRGEYTFSATSDGQVIVSHAVEDSLDGTDKLRNIERVQFATGNSLGIIVGTNGNDVLNGTPTDDLMLGLDGNDVLNGGDGNDILVGGPNTPTSGNYADNFTTQALNNSSGATAWAATPWVETGDNGGTNSPSAGQIRIDNNNSNTLQFRDDDTDTGNGTATIQRTVNLAGATSATLSYDYNENSFDAGEIVTVTFAADGVNFNQTIQVIDGNSGSNSTSVALTGPFSATSAIRFVVSGTNNNSANDVVSIDNLVVSFASAEILNGGAGDDIYSFALADGTDIINETSGNDRISIASSVLTNIALNEITTGAGNDNLVLVATSGTSTLQVTVTDHFDAAGEAVDLINFNGSTFEGYVLTGDYALSTDDTGDRTAAAGVNTALIGTTGGDTLVGNTGLDLLFGHDGNDTLSGGLGEDLLVGGAGSDTLDGGDDIDTLVGGTGDDTYVDDTGEDLLVEVATGGIDTVETLAATYSLVAALNVENLEYTGVDADQFVGTGNALANVISGGDLADTLTGLAGADTLNGGLGADTMIGGADNDVYVVDDAGDVVDEAAAGSSGTDRVESDIDYTLGAGVENLDLNNNAVTGRGNTLNNVINGNDAANLLFGGAGLDTLNGGDGNDVLDGGADNDTLNGGDDNDTFIGGAGNDTIDVGGGVNTIVYNATGFGADIINSFDATGGTPANQDRIDLSGLGVTAANFANRVFESASGANTIITIRENGPASAVVGTIQINGVNNAGIDITDFTLATPGNVINGAAAGQTHNGTAGNDTINALGGNDTVNAGAGNDIVNGGIGNDTLNGDAGDDTFNWNANNAAANSLTNSDGRDVINGGTEGGAGDTYAITGNAAAAETYRIYTRQAFDAVPNNSLNGINGATEIIITRGGTTAAFIIAELREIEEIRINAAEPSANGNAGGDTFEVIGDFSGTSLRLNTITIDGQAGDDTVDITSLSSAHRIVFKSNGGRDTVIGTLRPQDVIELPNGAVAADYTTTTENGITTMTNGVNSITFTAPEGRPEVSGGDTEASTDTDTTPEPQGNEDDADPPAPPASSTPTPKVGSAQADVILGTDGKDDIVAHAGDDVVVGAGDADTILGGDGADFINAGAGRDVVMGGAGDDTAFGGADSDLIYGDAGNDRIFGDAGDDVLTGGAGDDSVIGGGGNDVFVAENGDGNDVYFGDEATGGSGSDTIDLSAIGVATTVDLGAGGHGSATSAQSGTDTLWHIENVITGAGADTIIANASVNSINGGAGNDVFKFDSAAAANGDTIVGFQTGDRIDLSGIDANGGTAGNQAFALLTGSALSGAGKLIVTHETRADGDYTVVHGSVDADIDAEFRINIAGTHNLTTTDFNL